MSTAPHPTARGLLVWMQSHHGRLLELVDVQAVGGDHAPAGDPAIHAHLRFLAEALAANAGPGQAAELDDFAEHFDDRMRAAQEVLGDVLEQLEDATAFEAESQFGDGAKMLPLGPAFDEHFRGSYVALFQWFRFCMEVNFGPLWTWGKGLIPAAPDTEGSAKG